MERLQEVNLALVLGDIHLHNDALHLLLGSRPRPRQPERRVQMFHQGVELRRGDVIGRVGVEVGPQADKLHHVILAHRRLLVLRGVLEVVENHSDHEVEHDEGAEDHEDAEEDDRRRGVGGAAVLPLLASRKSLELRIPRAVPGAEVRRGGVVESREHLHAVDGVHTVVHDPVPALPRGHPEEDHERVGKVLEVCVAVEELPVAERAEQVHPHNRENEEE
mmetsp:Transcript_58365/g.186036  ORF Transcript_58365/g.186036 Transcript_58365/m.186036 type:complete len:220 (-) Transcript_58365:3088-3747(-)